MNTQERYWQEFILLKRDALYFDLYQCETEKIDRYINIVLAVASSSSIGAWTIWHELNWLWGSVIAVSQVINAVKEYLPYQKRLKSLSALSRDVNILAISAENDWFRVKKGKLTDEEIHELQMKLKSSKLETQHKTFPDASLPENFKLLERADKDIQIYIATYF